MFSIIRMNDAAREVGNRCPLLISSSSAISNNDNIQKEFLSTRAGLAPFLNLDIISIQHIRRRRYLVGRAVPVSQLSKMSPSAPNSSRLSTAITTAAFVLPMIYIYRKNKRQVQEQKIINEEREQERAFLSSLVKNPSSQPLRPPLPEIVRRVLSRCSFAYLSTIDVDSTSSHLSLMRFTYLANEETIIMSTNVKTKKYDMLEKQNGVALLIHDFGGDGNLTGEYSITLNGTCSVVKDGK